VAEHERTKVNRQPA